MGSMLKEMLFDAAEDLQDLYYGVCSETNLDEKEGARMDLLNEIVGLRTELNESGVRTCRLIKNLEINGFTIAAHWALAERDRRMEIHYRMRQCDCLREAYDLLFQTGCAPADSQTGPPNGDGDFP